MQEFLSIVIPCFNEEENIEKSIERCAQVAQSLFSHHFEIILIDDGSKDSTWQKITNSSRKEVKGLKLSRNFGHQIALSAGLEKAAGDWILILDGDLQDPPELLKEMLDKAKEGYDIVYGKRKVRKGESFFKKFSAYCFYRFINFLSEVEIPVDTGDFRLMNRKSLDALLLMPEKHRFIRGMVAWIGFKQGFIEFERSERSYGETKYTLLKMLRLASDAITSFSIRPVRMGLVLSVVFILLALILMAKALFSYSIGEVVSGWTSLMITLLFLGSGQFLLLGLIGEYIGRTFEQVKNRPLYFLSEIFEKKD